MINEIIEGVNVESTIQEILAQIHNNGPIEASTFEKLAYIKRFQSKILAPYEGKLLSLMGLFYKTLRPKSILEEVYSIYSKAIEDETGKKFTPVQANAYKEINRKIYFSFSAPTSAGKSFLFRELIKDIKGDIIIVVPSRALISEYYYEVLKIVDKSVLVLQFIDNINTSNIERRVFIITPERGPELFKRITEFNIELFLFDEAQISEEIIRGMRFDSFVRRVDRILPKAKKVFAHPFVNNPEAQLLKHGFDTQDSAHKSYAQHSVGKIFTYYDGTIFKYFSPYENVDSDYYDTDLVENILKRDGTLLIYTSKDKIYEGKHLTDFGKYIELCPIITDRRARKIIEELRDFIGASKEGNDKRSMLIDMMERGIVIHHGSIPLKARLLIEDFIKQNFARICFATSTLNQGINMPFDVVWLDNFTRMDPLTLKNLIGRAGRSTTRKNQLDYGFTIVKKANVRTFSSRINEQIQLRETSLLDVDFSTVEEDQKDIVEAINTDTFNDAFHLTQSQVERLKSSEIDEDIEFILANFLKDGVPITGKKYYELGSAAKNRIKNTFKRIFIQHLRRKELTKQEATILSAAIPIMLWHIQGKSFSEIVSLRYAFLSQRDIQREVRGRARRREITFKEAHKILLDTKVRYTPIASPIPNKNVSAPPLFFYTSIIEMDYDKVVYDTYDFLDKVISLSITDPLCATLELYYQKTKDIRAIVFKNYVRYGTNDSIEIMLLRYGFGFEDIDWLKDHVANISEEGISFKRSIRFLEGWQKRIIERYV